MHRFTMRSAASSVSMTKTRCKCRDTRICSASRTVVSNVPYAASSIALTKSRYRSPLYMMDDLNFQVPLLPSRFFVTEDGWFSQPGVQDVRRGLRSSCPRCRCPCLLEFLNLCCQLSDSSLVFNSGLPYPSTDYGLHVLVPWNHGCVITFSPLETRLLNSIFSQFHVRSAFSHARRWSCVPALPGVSLVT